MRTTVGIASLSPALRRVLLWEALLLLAFLAFFGYVWRLLPAEGVKLHANIDTGVDLYGNRQELLWLLGLAAAMVGGNTVLAVALRHTQPFAAILLVSASVPLLVGFLGVLLFILRLNAGP